MTGTVLGTAGYLAPEQAQGDRAAPASDRYALAIVAYELLTGTRPFEADSPTAEAAAHVNAPVPSISSKNGLPRELDPVFERALAKDPARRYETCADFVAALRAAFADAAGATRTLPATVPLHATQEETAWVPPPTRRSRAAWPLLAALLVAGAIAGALLAFFLTREGGETAPPTTVVTEFRTVTTEGEVRTVEKPVTVTTSAAESPPPVSGESGAALNDAGFRRMQAGDYAGALPLLERAVQRLQGTGSLTEAYASYNLAFTRFQLGSCDGVLDLLDRSESIQGRRSEIDRLRGEAQGRCD
jgi:eukaryotic-like serine/threonine-protein kinase